MTPAMAPLHALASQFGPAVSHRWFGAADHVERLMLRRLAGPVLEVGCGPGRLVEALIQQGTIALGIDVAPAAVEVAVRRGVPVLNRCVFDPLPGEGDWASVVLLDGSIGIGGDPLVLLSRIRGLVRAGGVVLAEVDAAGVTQVRRILVDGAPWAAVDADDVPALARAAGYAEVSMESVGKRWFAWLRRGPQGRGDTL